MNKEQDNTVNIERIAPKDPIAKKEAFYILLEKELFAAKMPDGQAVSFIDLDTGRLINAAQISGHVEDCKILDCLRTTEGFRRLVDSIGVTVTSKRQDLKVRFAFKMYGQKDRESGSELSLEVHSDGRERILSLDTCVFSDADDEPGQIRFTFEQPDLTASASVKLYLKEGFHAPNVPVELPVDFMCENYHNMIKRSLLHMGNNVRIKRAVAKAQRGEEVTLAFIGGSITQGSGAAPSYLECYAYKTYRNFANRYGSGDNVKYIKAGIGGTPSELGMIRFHKDVCGESNAKPDIVFIEFAVNDDGDETKGVCYESLVRKVLLEPYHPAVVLVFSVFADDFNLQDRLAPVGFALDVPMTSVKDAVCSQFALSRNEGGVITKNQYFYDLYHPSNAGHTVMADCIGYLIEQMMKREMDEEPEENFYAAAKSVIGCNYVSVEAFDRLDVEQGNLLKGNPEVNVWCEGFTKKDENLQFVERNFDSVATPTFPNNWFHDCGISKTDFRLDIYTRALFLIFKDSDSANAGRAEVYVDGAKKFILNPRDVGWIHCNTKLLFEEKECAKHTIEIKMAPGEENKEFTILGFGYCGGRQ